MSIAFKLDLTLNTTPQMVVPVFLAVGNLAPIFSNIAFLQRNQMVSIDETSQSEHCRYLLRLPFAVFKRKSTTMFRSDSAANSRHVENFCGVIVRVHVLIWKNRWKQVGSWTQPLSLYSLSSSFVITKDGGTF